ncbi:MAG: hypothetical protein II429_07450, partial [Prevotella sp.]|nr:hypothetical protein [Prevotella sp.]
RQAEKGFNEHYAAACLWSLLGETSKAISSSVVVATWFFFNALSAIVTASDEVTGSWFFIV